LTPLGSGPLANAVGRNGDTTLAKSFLEGKLPPSLTANLFHETTCLLKTLAAPCPVNLTAMATITPEDFVGTYNASKETTSSSHLDRHIGHYKAILKDASLVHLHSTMMSLPLNTALLLQDGLKLLTLCFLRIQATPVVIDYV
jgi:hypothetical protein